VFSTTIIVAPLPPSIGSATPSLDLTRPGDQCATNIAAIEGPMHPNVSLLTTLQENH